MSRMTASSFRPALPSSDPSSPDPSSPDPSNPSPPETNPGNSGSTTEHLDRIVLPGAEAAAAPPGDEPPAAPPGGIVGKDEFFTAFRALFAAPNVWRAYKGRAALQSLKIEADDAAARQASDALYDTCLDVPWLRWLLAPENKWLERAVVIGTFAYARGTAVSVELRRDPAPSPAIDTNIAKQGPNTDKPEPDPEPRPEPVVIDGVSYDGVLE